jgi:hypothetical protein
MPSEPEGRPPGSYEADARLKERRQQQKEG